MALAQLKLGVSQATLQVMPSPNLPGGMNRNVDMNRILDTSIDGQRSITYIGGEREDVTLSFTNLRQDEYDLIRQYCNTGEYYCEILSSLRTYFQGWVEIEFGGFTEDMHTPDYRRSFSVILREL